MAIPNVPTPSANLSAVAAFARAASEQDSLLQMSDLGDPPPPSSLQPRLPSSRRTLTRALELAREAVQLDAANDNPEAAVKAYGLSVALLSEVMERVRRGEESTDNRRRGGKRRSSTAQEEEVRRLQSIHDTYADRMNILSIIYSIPPAPSNFPSSHPDPVANINSDSPSPDSSDFSPAPFAPFPTHITQSSVSSQRLTGHDPDDGTEAIGEAMFQSLLDDSLPDGQEISGLPPSSSISSISHPYAFAQSFDPVATQPSVTPPSSRASVLNARRSRAGSSAIPPAAAPPPINALPPAPAVSSSPPDGLPVQPQPSFLQLSPGIEPPAKLEALREDEESTGRDSYSRPPPSEFPPPRPPPLSVSPFPDDYDINNVRPGGLPRPPPSPRSNIIVPQPRVSSSTVLRRAEQAAQLTQQQLVINNSTTSGTIHMRRSKSSAPADSRSSSPADSTGSASSGLSPRSMAGSTVSSVLSRSRSSSQPGRPPPMGSTGPPPSEQLPPMPPSGLPPATNGTSSSTPRRSVFVQKLNPNSLSVQTDLMPPPVFGLPTTPISALPPPPPSDPLRKPYYMMNLLRGTMETHSGGYVTRRLHVPQEVWSQGGAKLTNTLEKVRVVGILCQALDELQTSSSDYFGAGNVSSGLAGGIGSVGKKEAESWIAKLDEFSGICEGVVANFGKKLGVGEGFVSKKSTWGDRVTRRFDKFTNGKNLDSPQAYSDGLKRLFHHAQLLDEHTQAVFTAPIAPAYAGFSTELRAVVETKLKRSSQFFASVVLTFVIRDLSQLLDKYVKKCEKWLEE